MTVTLERLRENVGPRAFNLEYGERVSPLEIRDDLVSYLCEYRLKIQKWQYAYTLREQPNLKICDCRSHEPMTDKVKRAIQKRKCLREPVRREEAELEGFLSLEDQLAKTGEDPTILWASPPGPKSEGYGDYGFIYFGKIDRDKKSLAMTAIRVENPTLEAFNRTLTDLLGEKVDFRTAEDFLSQPFVLDRDIDEQTLNRVLMGNFWFVQNKDKESMFRKITGRMDSMVNDFVDMIRRGIKEGRVRAFNALENYALKLKAEYENFPWEQISYDRNKKLGEIVADFSHQPPVVGGSCGSSSSENGLLKSNNILSLGLSLEGLFLEEDEFGERTFECPSCGKVNIRPKGKLLTKCQHCGSREVAC